MASELIVLQPKSKPVKVQESLDSFSFANTAWEALFRTVPFQPLGSKEGNLSLNQANAILFMHAANNVAQELPDEIPRKYRV